MKLVTSIITCLKVYTLVSHVHVEGSLPVSLRTLKLWGNWNKSEKRRVPFTFKVPSPLCNFKIHVVYVFNAYHSTMKFGIIYSITLGNN